MLSLFFYLISSLACLVAANFIKNDPVKILDIIHRNSPECSRFPYASDILVFTQAIFTAIVVDSESLREMFIIMGIVQFCRVICSLSTVLPPLKNYQDKYRIWGINGSGTEYLFSGHAAYSALSAIYLYKNNFIGGLPLILYNLVSQALIALSRNHYTVDIVLAWIITPLVYGNIFLCIRMENCKKYLDFIL